MARSTLSLSEFIFWHGSDRNRGVLSQLYEHYINLQTVLNELIWSKRFKDTGCWNKDDFTERCVDELCWIIICYEYSKFVLLSLFETIQHIRCLVDGIYSSTHMVECQKHGLDPCAKVRWCSGQWAILKFAKLHMKNQQSSVSLYFGSQVMSKHQRLAVQNCCRMNVKGGKIQINLNRSRSKDTEAQIKKQKHRYRRTDTEIKHRYRSMDTEAWIQKHSYRSTDTEAQLHKHGYGTRSTDTEVKQVMHSNYVYFHFVWNPV